MKHWTPSQRALLPLLSALLLPLAMAAPAGAQPGAMPRGPADFATYDQDGDGFVSRAEFDAVRAERRNAAAQAGRPMRGAANAPGFEQIDRNGDDRISPDEFANHRTLRPRGGGPGAGMGGMGGMRGMGGMGRNMPSFASFDANGDGFITQAEYDAARSARITSRLQQGYPMRNLRDVPFADLDTNRDGKLDAAEFAAHQASHRRAPAR